MLFQGVMTGFVTSVLKKVVEDLFKSCKRKNAVSVPMARHVKTTAEATVTRNENGLSKTCQQAATLRLLYLPGKEMWQ